MGIVPSIAKAHLAIPMLLVLGLASGAVAQGFKYWNPLDTNHVVPPKMSSLGLYTDILSKNKKLLAHAYPYEVNLPSWSDGARKKRWVLLKPGSAPIGFVEKDDYWEYPDSAVFIEQLSIDTISGDSTSRIAWETRILLLRKDRTNPFAEIRGDNWFGYSYKWNADQKDAVLVSARGQNDSIRVYPRGKAMPPVMKKWTFPPRFLCTACHRTGYSIRSEDPNTVFHGRSLLGFFTAQLNRPHADSTHLNQIEFFFRKNVLGGTKPVNYETAPKWRGIEDTLGTDDQKARAYLAANCSGCHGARGLETGATHGVSLNFDYHSLEPRFEFRHEPTTWGFGLDEFAPFFYAKNGDGNNPYLMDTLRILPALVIPGYPEKSVILFRQTQRNSAPPTGVEEDFYPALYQMPPLDVFEKDTAALNLMTRWIRNMPRIPAPKSTPVTGIPQPGRMFLKGPAIRGRSLIIPAELSKDGQARVTMTSLTGRTEELARTNRTTFAIPANLPRGVYIIKVGGRGFMRNLF